jgi:hypothetical protein
MASGISVSSEEKPPREGQNTWVGTYKGRTCSSRGSFHDLLPGFEFKEGVKGVITQLLVQQVLV